MFRGKLTVSVRFSSPVPDFPVFPFYHIAKPARQITMCLLFPTEGKYRQFLTSSHHGNHLTSRAPLHIYTQLNRDRRHTIHIFSRFLGPRHRRLRTTRKKPLSHPSREISTCRGELVIVFVGPTTKDATSTCIAHELNWKLITATRSMKAKGLGLLLALRASSSINAHPLQNCVSKSPEGGARWWLRSASCTVKTLRNIVKHTWKNSWEEAFKLLNGSL